MDDSVMRKEKANEKQELILILKSEQLQSIWWKV